jgi:hypothetical protein
MRVCQGANVESSCDGGVSRHATAGALTRTRGGNHIRAGATAGGGYILEAHSSRMTQRAWGTNSHCTAGRRCERAQPFTPESAWRAMARPARV